MRRTFPSGRDGCSGQETPRRHGCDTQIGGFPISCIGFARDCLTHGWNEILFQAVNPVCSADVWPGADPERRNAKPYEEGGVTQWVTGRGLH